MFPTEIPVHGGARPGAGRPRKLPGAPKTEIQSSSEAFQASRARHEAVKCAQRELKLKIESGQYLERSAVQRASATTISMFANGMRALADDLERRGLPPDSCEMVDQAVNDALLALSVSMELMCMPPTPAAQ